MTTSYKEPQIGIEPMTAALCPTPLSRDYRGRAKNITREIGIQEGNYPQKKTVGVSKVCLAFFSRTHSGSVCTPAHLFLCSVFTTAGQSKVWA